MRKEMADALAEDWERRAAIRRELERQQRQAEGGCDDA